MPIREVTGQGTPVDPLKKDKSSSQVKGKAGSKESKDRVEVSQEARALIGSAGFECTFRHVTREHNRDADKLANRAIDSRQPIQI